MAPLETPTDSPGCAPLRQALREAALALKENGRSFALAGTCALWAYGAPEPSHDVDLVIAESDVAAAAAVLTDGVLDRTSPGRRAFQGPNPCDVLHRVNGVPGARAMPDSAERHDVLAIGMPVLPPTMVLIQKLRSLGEHQCDFAKLLPAVRAIGERMDWGARQRPDRRQRLRCRFPSAGGPAGPHRLPAPRRRDSVVAQLGDQLVLRQ
jgi:hypothetical protein